MGMMVIKLLSATAAAFGLHRFYEPSMGLGERWGNMFREAIGMIGAWPFVVMVAREMPCGNRESDHDKCYSISYAMVMLFFGAGVLLGHLFDRMAQE